MKKTKKNRILNGWWVAAIAFLVVFLSLNFLAGAFSSLLGNIASEKVEENLTEYIEQSIAEESENTALTEVSLVRVVDGDTLIVNMDNEETRVRLIGVDAPESVHPDESKNTIEGMNASQYMKNTLKEGDVVYLQIGKEPVDKYGRTLAYVWLSADVFPVTKEVIKDNLLEAKLITFGYATPKSYKPNTEYDYFLELIYEEYLENLDTHEG